MSDERNTLVDRLKGKYKIGVNGEFGVRDFSSERTPIHFEAAKRIEELEAVIREANDYLNYNELTSVGSGSAIHNSFKHAID